MAKAKRVVVRFQDLPIGKIERAETQTRAETNLDVVKEYGDLLNEGVDLGRPVVYFDGAKYWLSSGFHRVGAYELVGAKKVNCEVRKGDKRAAILNGVGDNGRHGLRMTNADKRAAVLKLLRDEEWKRWSDAVIAKACAVSRGLVGLIRKEDPTRYGSESTERKGADGRGYDMSELAAANTRRGEEKRAQDNAGKLTPDAAPNHKPRVVRDGAQDAAPEDVPSIQRDEPEDDDEGQLPIDSDEWEPPDEDPRGGDLVEDGAMAKPEAILGPGDPVGRGFGLKAREGVALWSEVATLATDARKLKLALGRLSERAKGTWFVNALNRTSHDLKAVEAVLESLEPYVCPYCKGTYDSCPECAGLGWLTRDQYEGAPATLKDTEQLAGDVDHWLGKLAHHNDACRSA